MKTKTTITILLEEQSKKDKENWAEIINTPTHLFILDVDGVKKLVAITRINVD